MRVLQNLTLRRVENTYRTFEGTLRPHLVKLSKKSA